MNHSAFLEYVQHYVKNNPEVAAYVSDSVRIGVEKALEAANERAADFEVATAFLLAKRLKDADSLVLNKLRKWEGKSSLNWVSQIDKLSERLGK